MAKNYILTPDRLHKKMCASGPRRNQMAQSAQFIILLEKITQHACPAWWWVSGIIFIYWQQFFSFQELPSLSWAKTQSSKIKLGISVLKSKGWCYFKLLIHFKRPSSVYFRCWGDDRGQFDDGLDLGSLYLIENMKCT